MRDSRSSSSSSSSSVSINSQHSTVSLSRCIQPAVPTPQSTVPTYQPVMTKTKE